MTTHYATLVQSASLVTPVEVPEQIDKTNINQLSAAFAAENDLIENACNKITTQCRVPLQYTAEFVSDHMSDISTLRNFARVLMLRCDIASREHDYQTIAALGIRILDLGNAMI